MAFGRTAPDKQASNSCKSKTVAKQAFTDKERSSSRGIAGLFRKIAIAVFAGAFFAASAAYAAKPAGIVIDANTGKVLYNQDSGGLRYPASLTKMMTLYLVFEALKSGQISKSTPITMSATAAGQAPTKLGVKAGGTFTVEQGILALITRSANDVAWAFAEKLGGSVPNFGKMMTAKARALGMRSTIYVNPNGLPDDRQVTTARDQAMLAVALRQHFPQYYPYFSVRSFRFGRQVIGNHNHLLGRVQGVDGIKTGYTRAAGFNLATSAQADGHSIVVVVLGERSGGGRDARVTQLVKKYLPAASSGRRSFEIARSAPITVPEPVIAEPSPRKDDAVAVAEVASADSDALPHVGPVPDHRYDTTNRIDQAFAAPEPAAEMPPMPKAEPAKVAVIAPPADLTEKKAVKARAEKVSAAKADNEDEIDDVKTSSTKPKSNGWSIQVGAAQSKELAKELLDKAQSKGGKVLRSADPYTVAVVADGAKVYRARFGGFRKQDTAVKACKVLKRRGMSCWASLD